MPPEYYERYYLTLAGCYHQGHGILSTIYTLFILDLSSIDDNFIRVNQLSLHPSLKHCDEFGGELLRGAKIGSAYFNKTTTLRANGGEFIPPSLECRTHSAGDKDSF